MKSKQSIGKPYQKTPDCITLTEKEIINLSGKIAKRTYKFLERRIKTELNKYNNYSKIQILDFMNIVIGALSLVDINILKWMQEFHKQITKEEISLPKLIYPYIMTLILMLDEQDQKLLKEKLKNI